MPDAQPAARITDTITHTEAKTGRRIGAGVGAVLGALVGYAIITTAAAGLAALEVGTGGLATPIVVIAAIGAGTLAAGAAGMTTAAFSQVGADLGNMMTTPQGQIYTGEHTVLIGTDRHAAAHAGSNALCDVHRHGSGPPTDVPNPAQEQIVEGSATVRVGTPGWPMARVGSLGTCHFKVGQGCPTVTVGGPTVRLAMPSDRDADFNGDDPEKAFFDRLGQYSGYAALLGATLLAAPAGPIGMAATFVGMVIVSKAIGAGLEMLPPGLPRDSAAALLTLMPLAGLRGRGVPEEEIGAKTPQERTPEDVARINEAWERRGENGGLWGRPQLGQMPTDAFGRPIPVTETVPVGDGIPGTRGGTGVGEPTDPPVYQMSGPPSSSTGTPPTGGVGIGSGSGSGSAPSTVTPAMEQKILQGERVPNPASPGGMSNRIIGGHSPDIKTDPNVAHEVVSNNADGTTSVKFYRQFSDGKLSQLKSSTLAPDSWSNQDILDAVNKTENSPSVDTRVRDGATLHRQTINGVEWEVVKDSSGNVTSAYPTGGNPSSPGGW